MMSYLIVKELRSPYTDYLIILQYWSIWITFVYFISESIILTISPKALQNFWYSMIGSFWGTPLLYYIFNQLSWYILIQHLKYTRLLARQTSYDTIKSYIRKQEMGAILFVVLFSVVWLCIIIFRNYFLILRRDEDSSLFNIGYHAFIACMLMVMTANEYFLYRLLNRLMKVHLNFYYKKQMKSLRMLAFANVIFYFTYGTLNLVVAIIEPDINEIVGLVPTDNHSSSLIRIVYLLWLIIESEDGFHLVFKSKII